MDVDRTGHHCMQGPPAYGTMVLFHHFLHETVHESLSEHAVEMPHYLEGLPRDEWGVHLYFLEDIYTD